MCGDNYTCQPVRDVLKTGNNTLFWVDQASGNDNNAGTENQPWKTIQRATQANALQAGDAVIIRDGTYYGEIQPQRGGQPGNRITFAAFPGEEVVVSGARNINGTWTQDGSDWTLAWPFEKLRTKRVNDGHPQEDDARRRDMLIVDGKVLQAVYTRANLREGTFFLRGSPDNPDRIFVRMPNGKNPNNARMQTSTIGHLFNPSSNDDFCAEGRSLKGHFRLIGMTFRHVANEAQEGAVCSGSEGTLIEDVRVEWTNGSGLLISGNNHILRGVRAFNNGFSGVRGLECTDCLVENTSSRYNNWKGYDPFWESGGGKWIESTRVRFRNVNFSDNEGPGLWLDINNRDIVVEQSRFDNNFGVNLFIESLSNRNVVRNNVLTRARFARPAFYGYGLLIHAANNNVIIHNTFMNNEGGGMRIRADGRAPATHNRYYNNLFIANTKIIRNSDHKGSELSFEEHPSEDDAHTNKGNGNVFWRRSYATQEYHTFQFRPDNKRGDDVLRSSNLGQWQIFAKTDYNSAIVQLNAPHVQDTTDFLNGWRLAENSQFIGWGVELPSDIEPVSKDFDGRNRPARPSVGADEYGFDLTSDDDDNTGGGGTGGGGGGDNGGGDNGGGGTGGDGGGDGGGGDGGGGTTGDNDKDKGGGSDGGSTDDPNAPITIVHFNTYDVSYEDKKVNITWEVSLTGDAERYTVERSDDRYTYKAVGAIRTDGPQTQGAQDIFTYKDEKLPAYVHALHYRIRTDYRDGTRTYSQTGTVTFETPPSYGLGQTYPNPSTSIVRIPYSIPESAGVILKVYDMNGREVKRVVDRGRPAGWYEASIRVDDLAAGVYVVRLVAGFYTESKKISVVH